MERILLIEDDPYMLESLEQFLKSEGFEVVAVSDGFKAIEAAQATGPEGESKFALVITDVRMPGMDGIETLDKLGVYQPRARRMVITGYADQDAPLRAIQLSVDDYLMKPFGIETFLMSVKNALSRYRLEEEKAALARGASGLVTRLLETVISHSKNRLPGGESHAAKLMNLCIRLGESSGLSAPRLERMGETALWHDFAFSLADNPDHHGKRASDILAGFPSHEEIAALLRLHHARDEEIPLEAKILALCEAFLKLQEENGISTEKALEHLAQTGGYDASLLASLARIGRIPPDGVVPARTGNRPRPATRESLLHLAQVYSMIGEIEMSEAALSRIREGTESPGNEEFKCKFLLASAQNAIRRRDFAGGYALGEKALEIAMSSGMGSLQVAKIFLDMALAKLALSDSDKVEEMLEKAKGNFKKREDSPGLARTNLYLALCDLAHGKGEKWKALLEECRGCLDRDQVEEWLQSESLALSLPKGNPIGRYLFPAPSAAPARGMKIYSLGPLRIYRDGVLIKEDEWKSKKVKLLLIYLLFNMERPVTEERLCERFWPEAVERSRKNLHQTVYLLRRTLEPGLQDGNQSGYILPQRGAYQFNRNSPYWWDVAEFKKCRNEAERILETGNEKDAVASLVRMETLYQGDLLEDYPEETWCELDRQKLRETYVDWALKLAAVHEQAGEYRKALDLIGRVLARDAFHEMAATQQVRAMFRSGMRSEAIRKYYDWCNAFKRELNLGPPPALLSLYLEMTGSKG